MRDLTPDQLHTLRQMLGINTPDDRYPEPYRNYAAVNPGDPHYLELEALGAISRIPEARLYDASRYHWYECTPKGRAAAMDSHHTIRHPRSRRRYVAYLNARDTCNELTFREFLTNPEYALLRRHA